MFAESNRVHSGHIVGDYEQQKISNEVKQHMSDPETLRKQIAMLFFFFDCKIMQEFNELHE